MPFFPYPGMRAFFACCFHVPVVRALRERLGLWVCMRHFIGTDALIRVYLRGSDTRLWRALHVLTFLVLWHQDRYPLAGYNLGGARNSVELLSNSSFHSVPFFWMRLHRLLELMPKEQYMRFVSFGVVETVTLSAIRLPFFFLLELGRIRCISR